MSGSRLRPYRAILSARFRMLLQYRAAALAGLWTMSQYPLEIYRPWFRRFFLVVIPLGCIGYLPGLAILGRADPLGTSLPLQWIAPLAGPLFLLICLQAWRFGVRHYQSTGS